MKEKMHRENNTVLTVQYNDEGAPTGATLCQPLQEKLHWTGVGVIDFTKIPEFNFSLRPEICVDMSAEEVYEIAASGVTPAFLMENLLMTDRKGFYIRQYDPNKDETTILPQD